MFDVTIFINNGYEILFLNKGSCYTLPQVKSKTLLGAKRKIKKVLYDIGVSYYIEKEQELSCINENNTVLLYCRAQSYHTNLDDDFIWMDYSKLADLNIDKNNPVNSHILQYIGKILNIQHNFKNGIEEIHDQSVVKLDFSNTIGGTSIFLKTPEFIAALSFSVSFDISENNAVIYHVQWNVNRSVAEGDKSDIYILFSHTMALLVKRFFSEPIFVETGNYLDPESVEVNTSTLHFESSKYRASLNEDDFVKQIIGLFELFIIAMDMHGYLMGSFSNRNIHTIKETLLAETLFDDENSNKIYREEHICFYNEKYSYINLKNGMYDYHRIFENYEFELIDGVEGKLIYQKTNNNCFVNYIDNDVWNYIQKVLLMLKIKDYAIICQSNIVFIATDSEIISFYGIFHHKLADDEIALIMERRKREEMLLFINSNLSWKYPVDFKRFEQLVADLLEYKHPDANVRMVGKANNADGGRDILIIKDDGLIIAQCKAYNKSVNKSHVIDIRDTIDYYNATGYFLAVSSNITVPLIDHLCKLREKYKVDWWTERELFKLLKQYPILVREYKDIIEVK